MKARSGNEQGAGFSLGGSVRRLLEETESGAMPSVAVCFAGPSRRPALWRRRGTASRPGQRVPIPLSLRFLPSPSRGCISLLLRASELPCPIPGNTQPGIPEAPGPRRSRFTRDGRQQTKAAERPGEAGEGLAVPPGQVGSGGGERGPVDLAWKTHLGFHGRGKCHAVEEK